MDSWSFSKPKGSFGSQVISKMFWACLLSGAAVTLYRNDVLLEGARAMNQEARFLELEQRWLGGAPTGTPRQVQALTDEATSTSASRSASADMAPLPNAVSPSLPSPAAAPPPAGSAERSNASDREEEMRAAKNEGSSAETVSAARLADAPAVGDARKANDAAPREDRATASPKRSSVKRTASTSTRSTPSAPRQKREQVAAPKPEPKAAPKSEPSPAAGTDDFLRMSMRNAVKEAKTKKKTGGGTAPKRESASSYDPLNGDL